MKKIIYFIFIALIIASCSAKNIEKDSIKEATKPVNIILLIGDGMGLSQISSAFYYKKDKVNISRFQHIGLFNTSSLTHKITDSAAGSTAFATGIKTYNGAIGVDSTGTPVQNIVEILAKDGYKSGLISTSSITHATPASFFAHAKERKEEELIASQLSGTAVSFFVGGGLKFFNKRTDQLNYLDTLYAKGFVFDTTALIQKIDNYHKKYGFLLADKGMPKQMEGRGNFLPNATKLAIDYLSKSEKGFFLMVEGSQIDWAGHNNDAEYLITEMIDFDNAVGKALDFAEKDGNTLVIVLADHETGGFSLAAGSADGKRNDYNFLSPVFSTRGHSSTLIPAFAYGPGAEIFTGFYQNNEVFKKMLGAVGK